MGTPRKLKPTANSGSARQKKQQANVTAENESHLAENSTAEKLSQQSNSQPTQMPETNADKNPEREETNPSKDDTHVQNAFAQPP